MADEVPLSFEGEPYVWDNGQDHLPESVVTLWTEVANGLEKSQTVVWKSAVESLQAAERFLTVSEDARFFVEKYMQQIISILVEQVPSKIGSHERSCVQESLRLATTIIAKDLEIQLRRRGQSTLLEVVTLVFNRKKNFYKGNKGNWNNHMSGLPEVRLGVIDLFLQVKGFALLHTYMSERIGSPAFPDLDILHQVLTALGDIVPVRCNTPEQAAAARETEDAAIFVGRATMQFVNSCSGEKLKKIPVELLQTLQKDLSRIFDRLISSRRESTYEYYEFWRGLILRLIKSPSLPLRLFGWQQMDDLLDACAEHRPPPRFFDVSTAGCTFVNGRFSYIASTTSDGYAQNGIDISYQRHIPENEKDGGGKKLTLFRCTMRSQQKWWFLSEADEEQPGTDRDIDYYQHKSKEHDEAVPPGDGWITCRNAGLDPPPQLQSHGLMVPPGQEYNTLEHQLAEWAVKNDIVQIVLGDSVHREIVARSTALIKFLASMCHRDDGVESTSGKSPNQYCLQVADLLLAWKTCSRKTDAAVSVQIYQLLVSILPECPTALAIPLLEAVQATLYQGKDRVEYLTEVADFCAALAAANSSDAKAASTIDLDDDVRREVLEVLWSVLTHPDAASLKVYDTLKQYVTNELRVEPRGSEHRERYLAACVRTLTENSMIASGTFVDEAQALRIVKLTHFVLAACPRAQAAKLVNEDSGTLPALLFGELTSCLKRLRIMDSVKKTTPSDTGVQQATDLLSDRLSIIRYVYGVSDEIFISSIELRTLWDLCDSPRHREQLMIFVAGASRAEYTNRATPVDQSGPQQQSSVQAEDILSAVFTEETCMFAFLDLFCSDSISFQPLEEGAYKSFQLMFNRVRQSTTHGHAARSAAIDTLWRVCLGTANNGVATTAMKDLLSVYVAFGGENGLVSGQALDSMEMESVDNSFAGRVFECLEKAKYGLANGDSNAILAVERCLRILNAAIGQWGMTNSVTASTLSRLSLQPDSAPLSVILNCLPHGLRGQACYRKINIMVKRAQNNQGVQVMQPGDRDVKSPTTIRFTLDVHPLETLRSIKRKTATYCECSVQAVKPISVSGRLVGGGSRNVSGEANAANLNSIPEDSVVDEIGVVQGCEIVFLIAERNQQQPPSQLSANAAREPRTRDLSDLFCDDRFAGKLFENLLAVLEWLPRSVNDNLVDNYTSGTDTHKLVWDLLLAMPTNTKVTSEVQTSAQGDGDAMDVDSKPWLTLLDLKKFHRSVYVLLAIDAFLEPAVEVLSSLPKEQMSRLETETIDAAFAFRQGFIKSSGFDAVVDFFASTGAHPGMNQSMARMGNAVALRILKCCLFGTGNLVRLHQGVPATSLDEAGSHLMRSLSDAKGLLKSLASMVVNDSGISTSTISDILKFLRMLFQSPKTAANFVYIPGGMPEMFLVTLLLWEEAIDGSRPNASPNASFKIRKTTNELILTTPALADHALPWLTAAVARIEVSSDSTIEFFDVLQRLVADDSSTARSKRASVNELTKLATEVCAKLASCPRPANEAALVDPSTGVLCGCLAMLRAIIDTTKGASLGDGTTLLLEQLELSRWSDSVSPPSKGMFATVSHPGSKINADDVALIDLMGVVFDGFLSPGGSSAEAICCDKVSRQRAFDVISATARTCHGPEGYFALVSRINTLMTAAAPFLKHRWGQGASGGIENQPRMGRNVSKYSGLRNQGCTCYMNSFLQQVFMMPELRKNMCLAPLPSSLRSSGGVVSAKGEDLVGKKVSMQWDNGISYDAMVESFDKNSGMHTIRYCTVSVATVAGANHQQVLPQDLARLPSSLPDEFLLSEGRPGKETGVFEVLEDGPTNEYAGDAKDRESKHPVEESEDEAASRHLMEEVQRTFIHLDEGSRGRCFDPRALVEASACLKLEFDVWQQNDASEFATKLLDRLEISLKRWAPDHFRYLDHTFGLKQTKQKICKECGLKTNREEKLLNVDCQIRGKSDIHEALGSMTEVEIMEGDNQVFCDQCKRNTDTVLRTAISALPNMLILSLKRFDLDFTTFETVKLNSRCAFGQTLNMKDYTLDGLEATEKENTVSGPDDMDTGTDDGGTNHLADEDYEYKLAGVLVHAGVAQGGHYYSFIKDRSPGSEEQWYRFDDEDVTSFDPSAIETECFGGKVKKETKWPNGQVHTVESEQYANALMLFYEKVKPTEPPSPAEDDGTKENKLILKDLAMSSGYEAFEPDVKKSNVTHQWQAFLFDTELQAFLKGLLMLCCVSDKDATESKTTAPWKPSVIQMLLTFFFDVLLYSNERPALGEWVLMLEQAICWDGACARAFLARLASKTKAVSANWLRTYLSDCPDQLARNAAVRIFSAAFRSCLELESDQDALRKWTAAWAEQLGAIEKFNTSLPCSLVGDWYRYEDPQSDDYSLMGTILSFVNVLIEASPRNWRYIPELNTFVRDLAIQGNDLLRHGLIESQIPARLVCTVLKDRAPEALRAAFPGSTVASDVAESQMRPEANHSSPMMSMGGNHVLNSHDPSYNRGGTSPQDSLTLYEALGCLLGIRGIVHVPLVVEVDDSVRSHHVTLNDQVVSALRHLFNEWCAPDAAGMDKRDIEAYLQKCGIDLVNLPGQKIDEIMAKFPTTGGNHLSLDGFLAYYQDMVQSNELRVRLDLHTHGFRPDLSLRPVETRLIVVQGRERTLTTVESVVLDVTSSFGRKIPSLGKLADLGFDSFQFYVVASSTSEIVAEHLLAAAVWRRDTGHLIVRTLRAINQAPTGWVGNEALSSAIMVLRVLSSVPDESQLDRINLIMQCPDSAGPNADYGIGLLVASRTFFAARQAHNYPNEISYAYERYLGILKELLGLQSVFRWMSENRPLWSFMERDLLDKQHHPPPNFRSDFGGRRDREIPGVPVGHHAPSDSDGMPGMHDSEDDEDSRFEEMETYDHGPRKIVVDGAGSVVVNGIYVRDGSFERASKFSRRGEHAGKVSDFFLFQCNVSNNTKHWFLSIVPEGCIAGTSNDKDFYSAAVNETCIEFPPTSGWKKSAEGLDPPPTLTYHDMAPMEDLGTNRVPGPGGWDKGDQAPRQQMHSYGNT